MKNSNRWSNAFRLTLAVLAGAGILSAVVAAQDRLKTLPKYEQYLRMSKEMQGAVKVGVRGGKPFENDVVGHYAYRVAWSPDGKELLFTREPPPEHPRVHRGRSRDGRVPRDRP